MTEANFAVSDEIFDEKEKIWKVQILRNGNEIMDIIEINKSNFPDQINPKTNKIRWTLLDPPKLNFQAKNAAIELFRNRRKLKKNIFLGKITADTSAPISSPKLSSSFSEIVSRVSALDITQSCEKPSNLILPPAQPAFVEFQQVGRPATSDNLSKLDTRAATKFELLNILRRRLVSKTNLTDAVITSVLGDFSLDIDRVLEDYFLSTVSRGNESVIYHENANYLDMPPGFAMPIFKSSLDPKPKATYSIEQLRALNTKGSS